MTTREGKGFVYERRITFEDTNVVGNVYFVNYFRWQGHCRELFMFEHAPEVATDVAEGRLRLVTTHSSCDFFEELASFDLVRVHMRLERFVQCGVRLAFEYRVLGKDDREGDSPCVARGTQETKALKKINGAWQLAPLPDELTVAINKVHHA